MSIRSALHFLRLLRRLYNMERGFAHRSFAPGLWANGFFSQRSVLYPFDRFERRWFLSDWEIETRLERVNDPSAIALLENKLLFHLILGRGALARSAPDLTGFLIKGEFYPLGDSPSLDDALQRFGRLVCKPIDGAGGRDVSVIRSAATVPKKGSYLIEAFVQQHDYAAAIFPGSLNTIRIVTMAESGEAFIAGAAHRFGSEASAPVDNFKRGGLSAQVDLQTGRLSAGRSNPGLHKEHVHARHPETGAPIAGVQVPMWEDAKTLALRLAALFPGLQHIGWDICITEKGPQVIEGNSRLPNPNLIQAHSPILLDPKVRAFLRRHGVLSERRAMQLASRSQSRAGASH